MSKKAKFIAFVQEHVDAVLQSNENVDQDALDYFEALKTSSEKDKPQFTDNGKLILTFMKANADKLNNLFKAKDIAEGIFVSSRSVSGAIRKLVTDNYVEKVGQDPIVYSLTALGKEIVIE